MEVTDIRDGSFDVADGATVDVTYTIADAGFTIDDGAEVSAGSITGSSLHPDWTVEGDLEVSSYWTLWGDWTIDGGTADIQRMRSNSSEAVQLELRGGATLIVEDLLPLAIDQTFSDGFDHELIYGTGSNEFECGEDTATPLHNLYFGDNTAISPISSQSRLDLILKCELHIASEFSDFFVYTTWDTRGVDVYVEPIGTTGSETYQAIEMISTDYGDATPVFIDVPTNGQFRDLSFSDGDGQPLPVELRNDYANEAEGWDDKAAGLFRNVYVGDDRTVDFREVEGEVEAVIKYWGSIDIDGEATVRYWEKIEGEWESREIDQGSSDPALDELVISVQGTIFCDWNGDCEITNLELDDLDDAIERGPHDPLMDYNADGDLTPQIEAAAAYANYLVQPDCGEDGGGGGSGSEAESDLSALAELARV